MFVFGATVPTGPRPPQSRGFYITHRDAPQSVGLLWSSDQLVAETSTWQHTTLTRQTDIHALGGTRTHNLSRRAAIDPRLRPRGHWDRHHCNLQTVNYGAGNNHDLLTILFQRSLECLRKFTKLLFRTSVFWPRFRIWTYPLKSRNDNRNIAK